METAKKSVLELDLSSIIDSKVFGAIGELTGAIETSVSLDSMLPYAGRAALRAKSIKGGAKPVSSSTDEDSLGEPSLAYETIEGQESVEIELGSESYERPSGEVYYSRKWGEHTDVEVLRKARSANQYVLLSGNPGTGKTACIEAAFPDELYTILGSGDTEVSDLVGGYVQTPSGGFEWVDGVLVKAAEEGKVLLIDEVGLIDPKVLSVVYGLIDGRRELNVTSNPERGVVKAKEGFYLVAATNPNAAGVRLSEALLSRFTIHAEMSTDWARAKLMGVPVAIVVCSNNMSKKMENGESSWAPQMRELLAFKANAELFGMKWATENLMAACPEMDRPLASLIFSRVFGEPILPARI